MNTTDVELFTHPTCVGCTEALTALRALERDGRISLAVTSLGSPTGRRRAEASGVSIVPTVRLGAEYRLLARPEDLTALLDDLGGG